MSARKAPRKSPPSAAGTGADDKAIAAPRVETPKPARPPRKRRPPFVL